MSKSQQGKGIKEELSAGELQEIVFALKEHAARMNDVVRLFRTAEGNRPTIRIYCRMMRRAMARLEEFQEEAGREVRKRTREDVFTRIEAGRQLIGT